MTLSDLATVAAAVLLLCGLAWVARRERARRRGVLVALHHELRGLCREASELAEAVARRARDSQPFDEAFLHRFSLGEPQTYPALTSELWRLPPEGIGRAVEFHGQLAVARGRWAAW